VETDLKRFSSLEGEQYDTRHLVWETAHQLGSPIYSLRRSLILGLLPDRGDSLHFLDVGCGTGDYARALVERGHYVDAIDISQSAVEQTLNRIPERLRSQFHAQVGDFSLLGDQSRYDGIVCSEVMEHVQEDEALLRRLRSLLLPHGSLILSVPADPFLWSQDDVFSGHVRRYTREELVGKLERAGFMVEQIWSYGYPILRTYMRLKTKLLKENGVRLVSRHGQEVGGRFVLRFASLVINAFVWLLDRHILRTNKGIGFIVLCRIQIADK